MERFPEPLREHFEAPQHVGEPPGGAHLRGEARNAACGDHVVLYLRLESGAAGSAAGAAGAAQAAGAPALGGSGGTAPVCTGTRSAPVLAAAGFRARGCPVAMATASAACDALAGLRADASLPAALAARFEERFGAPRPAHRHALALVTEALRAALAAGPLPDRAASR